MLVATLAVAGTSGAVRAQDTVYIGGTSTSVEVNLDVLDARAKGIELLRPPPPSPPQSRLLVGDGAARESITLTPPNGSGSFSGLTPPRSAMLTPPRRSEPAPPPRLAEPAPAAAAARLAAPPPRPATARPAPIAPTPESAPPPQVASVNPAPRQSTQRAPAAQPPAVDMPPPTPSTRVPEPPAAPPRPETQREPAAQPPAATGRQADPAPMQTAHMQGAAALSSGQALRIRFAANESKLPTSAETDLKALTSRLEQDSSARLQLMAYASGSAETASRARRTSLARALAVRSFLIDQGVRSTRIDVRALGTNTDGGPSDRVDVNVVKR
ncbi:MAG: OmpA family protein [Acetobacterales bacterium]